ncbi:hypothetical protein RHMOL_Rhmol02G0010600 [Rhododendron molle]|uniref:Uncharacterized protein n=1 Tax=Rhododendron molle TaxID=49168 RepID=A0ACC0PKF3_RHOML|nr:hypothetical protein RHMOL_Rhmol02G0010600 [Rhododendron molle]
MQNRREGRGVKINYGNYLAYSIVRMAQDELDGHDADDPKQSTADMTVFVQNLLQQMQSRFQTMSDSIITKNILHVTCFLNCDRALDEMGSRIDELEQSINDLRAEMGQEGSPSPSSALKLKDEPKSADDSA